MLYLLWKAVNDYMKKKQLCIYIAPRKYLLTISNALENHQPHAEDPTLRRHPIFL